VKKLIYLLLLLSSTSYADVSAPTEFTEADGSPSVYDPWRVAVSNGTLTDNLDGSISINTAGSGAAGNTLISGDNVKITTLGGISVFSVPVSADDTTLVSNGTNFIGTAIPNCEDTGGNHLNYAISTNSFACGTSGGSAGITTISSDPAGIAATGTLVYISGDANGIDVQGASNGKALNVSFDATEVGTRTWGSGSSIVWTFDAGATDPVWTYGSGTVALSTTSVVSFPAGTDSQRVGEGSTASSTQSTSFGRGATSAGADMVSVGYFATGGDGARDVVIGSQASVNSGASDASDAVMVGYQASVSSGNPQGTDSVCVGSQTLCNTNSVSIGSDASSGGNNTTISIGKGATASAANQWVVGGNGTEIREAYFGESVTNASPLSFSMNATGGTGTNIAGADLYLAGGKGTGNAKGGRVVIQFASRDASGTTLQTLFDVISIDRAGTNGERRISVDVAGSIRTRTYALTDASSIALDTSLSNAYTVTLTAQPRTLANPTNCVPGTRFTLVVSQDATGSRKMGFGTAYRFGTDVVSYDATTTAGARDYIGMACTNNVSVDIVSISKGY